MRKKLYICVLLFMSLNVMAQIDVNDPNWECVLDDDFSSNSWETWDSWKIRHPLYETQIENSHIYKNYIAVGSSSYYRTYIPEWKSGVSRSLKEHHVYQRENCQFGNNDNTMTFVSIYKGGADTIPLQCGEYDIPPQFTCDTSHHTLYYTTGKIESDVKYLYGYFEIKCSLPIHAGSFPAFWLFGGRNITGDSYYNEIDIFEYSNGTAQDYYRQFSCGIYCDNDEIPDSLKFISYARVRPTLPNTSQDLRHPHVFGCEWLPDRVTWYVDGNIVNEYTIRDSIPHHPMALKVNYAINNYAVPDCGPYKDKAIWFDGDIMTIDYLKVYQLRTDCSSSISIDTINDLVNFSPSVKESIVFEPTTELIVSDTMNIIMRAADSIILKNDITIPIGAQMTLIVHECPDL